jgi:hypothetical protein
MDNLQLTYDPSTDTYSNTYGVDIRGIGNNHPQKYFQAPPNISHEQILINSIDFGGTSGVDYLYTFLGIDFISVYAPLIQSLEELGYQVTF